MQDGLGPTGLALEFIIVLAVVFITTWGLFKRWSTVFWKKTDYAYFIFTIVGAATGAADLAISNWNKDVQHGQIDMLALRGDITTEAGNVSAGCDKQEAADKLAKSSSHDIIVPRDGDDTYEIPEVKLFAYKQKLSHDF